MIELLLVLSLEVHMSIQLSELIDMAVAYLEKLSLLEGTIKDYRQSAPSLIRLCSPKTAGRSIGIASTPFVGVFFYPFLAMVVRMLSVSHPSMSGVSWS